MVQAPLTTCWYQVSFYQTVSDNNLYYHLMNCQIAPLSVLLLRLKTFYTEKNIKPLLVKENTYGIINQKPTSLLKCTSRPWDRTTNFQPKCVKWINILVARLTNIYYRYWANKAIIFRNSQIISKRKCKKKPNWVNEECLLLR